MTGARASTDRSPLVLAPGEGRSYPMGRVSVVFKADGTEGAISAPDLEERMPAIADWFLRRPPGDADC